ncbi:FdhD protein [Oceanisphaera litoralis]|uniref:formate dehydrogenase accessory sulfurtransferase FdhD n=1 Tax=Oceanisphaera litoralis TaxID=225144 RepID=UPI00195D2B32|nr:formate dehydrogenase accessory sulfurtransferase FdhD [Oceanisphaera litoralis]MBM7455862.1 FdhD protein [Oceanisphaera litoralis]
MSDQQSKSCPAGVVSAEVERIRDGSRSRQQDLVAEEVPVALVYNGISHAVMMASPLDLEDFALGFSLTEGIIGRRGQIYGMEFSQQPLGIEIEIELSSECFLKLKEKRRALTGRTGCGLCGRESLVQALPPAPLVGPAAMPSLAAISLAGEQLQSCQTLHRLSGAVHAAAAFDQDGKLLMVREDVGRHNALDKLIGARLGGTMPAAEFIMVTSRASYEMVHKCAMLGVATLVAVSAPTSLAIDYARQSGINLLGFARGDNCVIYHRADNE